MHESPAFEKKILTVPNLLSAVRLCMIPLFVWLYCVKGDHGMTAVVLVLSGATDVVDGFIARRFGMISDLGKILDPMADKLTQAAMLLCLVSRFPMMMLPFILMALKETFAIVTGLLVIRRTKKVYSSAWHGKATTVSLYAMMILHVVWEGISPEISGCMIGICVTMMLLSWVLYGMQNLRTLRGKKEKKN